MKKYRRLFLLGLMTLAGPLSVKAQLTQSAMYDAIALMNATHGVNAIFIGRPHGWDILDPVTGKLLLPNQVATPAEYLGNMANSNQIIQAVLAREAGLPANASFNDLKAAYAGNPFLSDIFTPQANFAAAYDQGLSTYSNVASSTQSGGELTGLAGGLANGVADFLVQRAGEEISVSVFQQLKTFIGQYPEFSILFPRTIALLAPVQPYDYAKTLQALKAALQDDLTGLPANLPQLYTLPRYQLLNKKIPELTLIFASTELFTSLHGKNSLAKSLHDLDTAACLKETNNYATLAHLAIVISNSLREKLLINAEDGEYAYFTAADIELATHNGLYAGSLGKFYLGLIYQQLGHCQFYSQDGPHFVADALTPYAGRTEVVIGQLTRVSNQLYSLEQQLAALKKTDDGLRLSGQNLISASRYTVYKQLLDTALNLLNPLISGTPAALWQTQLGALRSYWPPFSGATITLIKDVQGKNYTLAAGDVVTLLHSLSAYLDIVKNDTAAKTALNLELSSVLNVQMSTISASITVIDQQVTNLPVLNTLTDANTRAAVALQLQNFAQSKAGLIKIAQSLQWEKDNGAKVLTSLDKVLGYTSLLASLSQAANAQEVQSILEAYALPAGSSRVKKDAINNIAVNAYVGGFYRSNSTGTGYTNQYGLTAPIGVAFSLGMQKLGSASLFASAFDIGSVIQYKLNNQGQYEQNINFAGLISPGLHLVYGFGAYLPFSAGIGCQWISPATATANSIRLQPYFNLYIAVDIPLFNLSVTKRTTN